MIFGAEDKKNILDCEKAVILVARVTTMPVFNKKCLVAFYEIKAKDFYLKENSGHKVYFIYAPSFIGTWLLYRTKWKQYSNVKLVINRDAIINQYWRFFLRLRLLYEKFRLGSDVPSPFIARILNRQGYNNILADVTISDWLQCIEFVPSVDSQVILSKNFGW